VIPHDTLVMSLSYVDWRREATTRRLTSTNSRVTDDAEAARLIVDEGRNFFQPFLERNPGIPCYHHTAIMPESPEKIPETRYYQRYMTPHGWRYSAHVLFWKGGNVETSIALRRRPDQGDFSAEEMAALRALHPLIEVAFARVRVLEGERRQRRLLETLSRPHPEAVLFLDWDLSLLYGSQEAFGICAEWNLGQEEARRFTAQAVFALPPEIAEACAKLRPEWEGRISGREAELDPPLLVVVVTGARAGYAATVTLRRESGTSLNRPLFIVRLRGPVRYRKTEGSAGREEGGQRRGRLTPAEREVADLVCLGMSNKEIAASLKRSEGSVKVQLSGIFQKLQVSSRAKLMVAWRG
jgi:DNA-binding CsgD family transcriptional regulator